VTVRDWLESRARSAPATLQAEVVSALGNDIEADVTRTMQVCLRAADRALRDILDARRFGREGALNLLVVDALTTYAYEYASSSAATDLGGAALTGVHRFGEIASTYG
jgi:uncharacterized membrane protein